MWFFFRSSSLTVVFFSLSREFVLILLYMNSNERVNKYTNSLFICLFYLQRNGFDGGSLRNISWDQTWGSAAVLKTIQIDVSGIEWNWTIFSEYDKTRYHSNNFWFNCNFYLSVQKVYTCNTQNEIWTYERMHSHVNMCACTCTCFSCTQIFHSLFPLEQYIWNAMTSKIQCKKHPRHLFISSNIYS